MSYFRSSYKGLVHHPAIITRLYILGGVQGYWEEEETCLRTSSLTLTGVTKGPKNRLKEKEVETKEKEGDERKKMSKHVFRAQFKRGLRGREARAAYGIYFQKTEITTRNMLKVLNSKEW